MEPNSEEPLPGGEAPPGASAAEGEPPPAPEDARPLTPEQTSAETTGLVADDATDALDAPAPEWMWGVLAGALLLLVAVWVWSRRPSTSAIEDAEVGPQERAGRPVRSTSEPGLAARLRERMARTREVLQDSFDRIFGAPVDEGTVEQLEEALLVADVGVPTAQRILERVRGELRRGERDTTVLRASMRAEIRTILGEVERPFRVDSDQKPYVVLVVGVNGSGKTTTIGKLAARLGREGHKVLIAAGDTYRAAAAEQLTIWAQRAGADIVAHAEGADPGAVVFDALEAARARGVDVVIIDTAGRLQTKKPLMEQLSKLRRVIERKVPGGPQETLLVIDGTMGQNALSQARMFHEATPLTGVVVTKLDGTAKGGMILAITTELGLPIKFIGIGEQVDDLRPFEAEAFATALG
jgi:fused signal recognition particle receptor